MIEFVSGILVTKDPNFVIVNVGGLGYKVFISLNTYNSLPNKNESILLLTYHNITEKSHDLFGFIDKVEKELFQMLISVSGIGPKIAINLLSFIKPEDFKQRLIAGEVELLTSLPGIGPKTARRIIIELKDKFVTSDNNELPIEGSSNEDKDVYSALIKLGFKAIDIRDALNHLNTKKMQMSTENKIKEALKILG